MILNDARIYVSTTTTSRGWEETKTWQAVSISGFGGRKASLCGPSLAWSQNLFVFGSFGTYLSSMSTPTAPNLATPPTGIYSPLSAFPNKPQQPTGTFYNPLHWPRLFSYHKSRLGLPNPGKFERLHGEVKGKLTFSKRDKRQRMCDSSTRIIQYRHFCHQLPFWRCSS